MISRRNPLVVLLCLELMLNAGNLALVAFSRMHGERGRPGVRADRDGDRRLRGRDRPRDHRRDVPQPAARSTSTRCRSCAGERHHVRLAGPRVPARRDAGHLASAGACCPGRLPGWIASARDLRLSFLASIGALLELQDRPRTSASSSTRAWTYAATGDFNVDLAILVDPLSVFMCLVVSGVSFLIHVYSVAYMGGDRGYARYFAYLNFFVFSMLLLVLAANFVLLIVGWAFVGAASYLLISFWYRRDDRHARRHQGVRDQRDRRRRRWWWRRSCSSTRRASLDFAGVFEGAGRGLRRERRHARGGLPADPRRRVRQVGAAAAPHLAAGRDGGPHPGLRPDPRRHDGHRRRLPDRAHAPAVRAGADRRRRRRDHRHRHARVRRPRSRSWSPT